MRPLKLTLNAFGPFVKKQAIDFQIGESDGIFLITGDTGAGKTSIFDGMCFALYGGASGDARKPSAFKSDHAPPGEVCFVEFSFQLRGQEYRLRRSPSQQGVKRDGTPKEIAPAAELIMPKGEVVTGAHAVTERVEQILGLNYRQFKQTTMLAQGEFKQLIEATGKEKQQVFSKIFGTSAYAGLTSLLIREEAGLGQQAQALQAQTERCVRALAAYGIPALSVPEAAFFPFGQIEAAARESLLLHTEKSAQLESEMNALELQKERFNPENAKRLNEKLDRRDRLRQVYEDLTAREPEIAKAENRILLLKAAAGLDEQEKIILSSKSQSEQCEAQIRSIESALSVLGEKRRALAENGESSLEITELETGIRTQKALYDKLYREFIDGQASFLASGLSAGEPCPVCGSVSHPSPAVQGGRRVTESDLNAAKSAAALLERQLSQAQEKLRTERLMLQNDYDKQRALLETQQSHRDALKAQFESQRAEFVKRLRDSGFSGYRDYSAARDGKSGLAALEKSVGGYRERLVAAASQLEELERDTKCHRREDLDALVKAYDDASRRLTLLRESRAELQLALAGLKARLSELSVLHAENLLITRKYRIARELASLAKGNRTVSFERYVLASYFDDILKLANIHLQRMTSARYSLRRRDEAGGAGSAGSGLDMEITDSYTGKIRDVSTLSGGESFKASLALALGLSGIVQIYSGGVSIDTMFIDEGFGSLDEKSLESAVETLVSLKKSGRMVGVISHVAALRDYIPQKLAVRYGPTGSTVGWA